MSVPPTVWYLTHSAIAGLLASTVRTAVGETMFARMLCGASMTASVSTGLAKRDHDLLPTLAMRGSGQTSLRAVEPGSLPGGRACPALPGVRVAYSPSSTVAASISYSSLRPIAASTPSRIATTSVSPKSGYPVRWNRPRKSRTAAKVALVTLIES